MTDNGLHPIYARAMRALVVALGRAGVAVYSCSPISGLNDVVQYVDIRTLPAA